MQSNKLPKGQRAIPSFPRFGLSAFANRFPRQPEHLSIRVCGRVEQELLLDATALSGLERVEQYSDFHCVTTWSHQDLHWSGYRFRDVYSLLIQPQAVPQTDATQLLLRGQDGYRSSLPLCDLLAEDVLIADHLNGEPLTISHGAPIRLLAPAHYGYKNVKHLSAIEFLLPSESYRPAALKFMDHPRARVLLEERGRGAPGWLYRQLYRPLVAPTIRKFAKALENKR